MQKNNFRESIILWVSFFTIAFALGTAFILVKKTLIAFSPSVVAALRLSSAFVVMLPFAIAHFKKIPREKFKFVLLSALFGVVIPVFLFAFAQLGINSSISGILVSLTPCMTFLIGISFFKQQSNTFKILGLALGFLGSFVLIFFNSKGELSLNAYCFIVVLATVCFGINLNITKKFLSDIKPIYLSSVSISLAGCIGLIVLFSSNWLQILQTNPTAKFSLAMGLILGVLSTAVAQTLTNVVVSRTSAFFTSSTMYFIPLVAVFWGVLDGETFSIWHFVGMILLLSGILIINRFK